MGHDNNCSLLQDVTKQIEATLRCTCNPTKSPPSVQNDHRYKMPVLQRRSVAKEGKNRQKRTETRAADSDDKTPHITKVADAMRADQGQKHV